MATRWQPVTPINHGDTWPPASSSVVARTEGPDGHDVDRLVPAAHREAALLASIQLHARRLRGLQADQDLARCGGRSESRSGVDRVTQGGEVLDRALGSGGSDKRDAGVHRGPNG